MNNKKIPIIILAIIAIGAGAFIVAGWFGAPAQKVVPEAGDEVQPDAGAVPVQIASKLDQRVQAGDVAITPRAVFEDSRCPADVVCIQAGTVRVRALVAQSGTEVEQEFTLGRAVSLGKSEITLVDVKPYPYAGKEIASAEYEFTWEVRVP